MNYPSPKVTSLTQRGFTLVELLVSMAVLLVLVLILANITNVTSRSWIDGEKRVESAQSGRAILDLISRDLASAVVGPTYQFVQNASLPALTPGLTPGSDNLFWQTLSPPTDEGNVAVVGYYLTRDDTARRYQLRRLYLAPGDPAYPTSFNPAGKKRTSEADAPWVSSIGAAAYDVSATNATASVLAEGVLAFWIRCLDSSGTPIEWWSESVAKSGAASIKFNSAARFQAGDPVAGSSFSYLAAQPYMPSGDQLPAFIEVTLVVIDSLTLKRGGAIPQPPTLSAPDELPAKVAEYKQALIDAGMPSAKVFTSTIKTKNFPQ